MTHESVLSFEQSESLVCNHYLIKNYILKKLIPVRKHVAAQNVVAIIGLQCEKEWSKVCI